MCDKINEDNESTHSDDSCASLMTSLKETLGNCINKTLKDSGAHNDLELRNSLLKLEEDNVNLTCRRLQEQIKKRNERLEEEFQLNFRNSLKDNHDKLEKQFASAEAKLENVNNLFYTAFEKYSSNFERNVINQGRKEKEDQEKQLKRLNNEINDLQYVDKTTDSVIKSVEQEINRIEQFINAESDLLLSRPNIKLEEEYNNLTKKIKELKGKSSTLKSFLNKN